MLTPSAFGLPAHFKEWRTKQLDAVDTIVYGERRFTGLCAPTGFGKSLAYMAAAAMSGLRTVVLTSTKGLQDQLERDFHTISQDIRGQSNYLCTESAKFGLPGRVMVEWGPCHSGAKCDLKSLGCEYFDRLRAAQRAGIVVANYAMWFTDPMRGIKLDELGPIEMLVLDEAHDAPGLLSDHVGTEMTRGDVIKCRVKWPQSGMDQLEWKEWAGLVREELVERVEEYKKMVRDGEATSNIMKEVGEWNRLLRKVGKVAAMKGEWVIEELSDGPGGVRVRFDPLWPALYAENELFRGVKRVVLVSATLRPKTMELLGVGSQDSEFHEFRSTFPLSRRPVIHVPTVQMNHRADDAKLMWWLQRMDQIHDRRKDRAGIVHTVSYARANLIQENSRHRSRMLYHSSKSRAETVQQFKNSKSPQSGKTEKMILVSPSVDTGYDFPYKECEYQIIAKVPFLDNRARVVKRRIEVDKDYSNYETALTIVQMTGRAMRAEDDQCETFIVDDNIVWFVKQNKQHFPQWWLQSYREEMIAPAPPPALGES